MKTQKLDISRIRFPSDTLTIKDLRRVHGEQIDSAALPTLFTVECRQGSAEDMLANLLYAERLLADAAFKKILGEPNKEILGREDCIQELERLYITYGIASGKNQVSLLVREIESQAAAQVREDPGARLGGR